MKEIDKHGSSPTRTTNFAYLGLTYQVTLESQSGDVTKDATKSYSYDAYGHRISLRNDPVDPAKPTKDYTYAYDVHGSVSALVDEAGSVAAAYGYDAYGEKDAGLTAGDPEDTNPLNPYRYSARRFDSGSGTIDMGARRFGPDTGRFLQPDLFLGALSNLGLSTDVLTGNRYALAAGNPLSFLESDGHRLIWDGSGTSAPSPNPRHRGPDQQDSFARQAYIKVSGCPFRDLVICAPDLAGFGTDLPDPPTRPLRFGLLGTIFEGACYLAGPCAIEEAYSEGNWAGLALEFAMLLPLPIGKLAKLAKIGERVDDVTGLARLTTRAGRTAGLADEVVGARQVTVLGRYSGGTDAFVGKPGFNVLDLPSKGTGRWYWSRNRAFIDDAIARGDELRLVTDPYAPLYSGGNVYQRELRYLRDLGYTFQQSGDSWIAAPGR